MNKVVIVDHRISQKSKETLVKLGYEIVEFPENIHLDIPISAHPDMSMTKILGKLFIENAVNDLFTYFGEIEICNREAETGEVLKYPYDISFNCTQVGNYLICNEKYTHSKIVEYAKRNSIEIINVKQGYAKCSTCLVSDNAVITEDDNISVECSKRGIDVLKVTKGHIKLDGYDYGFIGGCSGLLDKNTLAFNGNIELHPECGNIKSFCKKHQVNVLSLSDEPLYDVGSIIVI